MTKKIPFIISILILLSTLACGTAPHLPTLSGQPEPLENNQDATLLPTHAIDVTKKDGLPSQTEEEKPQQKTPGPSTPTAQFLAEFTDERMNHYCHPLPQANVYNHAIAGDKLYTTQIDAPSTLYEVDLESFERKQIASSEYPNGIIMDIQATDDWLFYIDAMEPGNRFDWDAYVVNLDTFQKQPITDPERTEKAIEQRSYALDDDVLYFTVLTQNENQQGYAKSAIVAFDLEDREYSSLISTENGDFLFSKLVVSDNFLVAEKRSFQKGKGVELYIYDLESHEVSILSPSDYIGHLSADKSWISWVNTTDQLNLYNTKTGEQPNLDEFPDDFLYQPMTLHDGFAVTYYTAPDGHDGWKIILYDINNSRFLSLEKESHDYSAISPTINSDKLHWFLGNIIPNSDSVIQYCEVDIDTLESWAGLP